MKTSRLFVFYFLLAFTIPGQANAQYDFSDELYYDHPFTYELGASVAMMNCFTDLGGKNGNGQKYFKDFTLKNSQIAGSVYFSTFYKYAVGIRAEATFGKVKAADNTLESVKTTSFGRYDRNLSFQSNIIEIMLALEIHPLYFKAYKQGHKIPRFSPYLMGGIGYFSFNPQTRLNGQMIDLQPLHTEGQGFAEYPNRKPYKLKQFNIPVGIGIKYKATPLYTVSVECVSRILSTDYLDDVSTTYIDPSLFSHYFSGSQLDNALQLYDRQKELDPAHVPHPGYDRGNAAKNDSYFTFNLKMSFIF